MTFRAVCKRLALSRLVLSLAGGGSALLLPVAAQAYGFTGPFAPGAWKLYSISDVPLPPIYHDTVLASEILPYNGGSSPTYLCPGELAVNCVNLISEPSGNAVLVGSDSSGHGTSPQSWATQWQMTLDPFESAKTFTFDWTFVNADVSNDDQAYYYVLDENGLVQFEKVLSSSGYDPNDPNFPGFDSGTGVKVSLLPGWSLGYGVYTVDNSGDPGSLSIQNFGADPVPAPLPVLGAAGAFAWSRRLRRRIRGQAGFASR